MVGYLSLSGALQRWGGERYIRSLNPELES